MQNDVARQLIDTATGQRKSFSKWVSDIQGITDHYVHSWLHTEYDTAVIRAHQAADWKHFLEEADVFPNIRWMPTTSIMPDPLHEYYWTKKLTLPVDHPFWQEHRPGDRWNCKCSLQQTDEPVNESPLEGYTPPLPMPGLDNNPAEDGMIFSKTHPYYTEAYPGAQQAVDNLLRKRSPSSLRRSEEEKEDIIRRWEERKAVNKNLEYVSRKLDLPVPQFEMDFETANHRRVNPKYWESQSLRKADILARTTNCQSCVVAYEMRRRGLNVEAALRKIHRVDNAFLLEKSPYLAFKVPGKPFDEEFGYGPKPLISKNFEEFVKDANTKGRYHMYWMWENESNGHIVTYEVERDGSAFFYDPQISRRYSVKEFLEEKAGLIKENSIKYYRVDNLPFSDTAIGVVLKSKKKR